MALQSVSLFFPVSVLSVKSWMYFYMLMMWSSCYTSVTGQHQVIGSQDILLVTVGDEVILPCLIKPPFNMARKTVEWSRPDLKPYFIFLLQDGHYRHDQDVNPLYTGRTSLFPEELRHGNMSLKLSRVKLSDEGTYRCSAPQLQSFTLILLRVGSGSQPVMSSNGPTDGGVSLSCDSGCWYPEPEMSWLDGDGTLLPAGPSVTDRRSPHCYIVQRNVTVTPPGQVTCRVHLPHINHTAETHRYISEAPTRLPMIVPTGIVVLVIVPVMSFVVGLLLCYFCKKMKQMYPHVKATPSIHEVCPCVKEVPPAHDEEVPPAHDEELDSLSAASSDEEKDQAHPEEKGCKKHIGGAGLFCAFIGTELLVAATVVERWWEHTYEDTHYYHGLWTDQSCKGTACDTYRIEGGVAPAGVAPALFVMGLFLILMVLLCVIGIIIGIISYVKRSKPSRAAWIMFLFSSGGVAVIIFFYTVVSFGMTQYSIVRFSWSYMLCWAALLMTLSASIFTFWAYRINQQQERQKRNGRRMCAQVSLPFGPTE